MRGKHTASLRFSEQCHSALSLSTLHLYTACSPKSLYLSGTPSALSNPLEIASVVTDSHLLELLTVTRPAPRHCVRTTAPFELLVGSKRSPCQDLSFEPKSVQNKQEPRAAELGEEIPRARVSDDLSPERCNSFQTARMTLVVSALKSQRSGLQYEHKRYFLRAVPCPCA